MPTQEEIESSKRKLGLTRKMAAVEQFPLPANQASPHAVGNIVDSVDDDLGEIPVNAPVESDEDLGEVSADPLPAEPDMAPIKAHFEEVAGGSVGIMEAIEKGWGAGWQSSVTGLFSRGKAPEKVLAPDASMAAKVASGIAQVAGDLPLIIPGTIAGAAAGSAVAPGVGTLVGAGAVGNAAPAAIRSYLMDAYEKGEFKDSKDFVARAMGMLWETTKQAAVGGVTGGVGSKVGKVVAPILDDVAAPVAGKVAARLAQPASEIATMTLAGSAIEGELPNAEDFSVAALMVATITGTVKVAGGTFGVSKKLRQIYAETGIKPERVVEDSKADPVLQQELLSDSDGIPKAYEPMKEPVKEAKPEVSMADVVNEPTPEIKPDHPAVKAILENVEDAPKPTKEGYSVSKAYTDFVDRLNPIKEVDEKAYVLSRMANDFKAKVKHTIEKGTIDFKTLKINGRGLNEIVAPFKDNLREFEAFLISKRALDYEKRGLHAGFDLEAAREVIKMGEKKYGAAAKELVEFQRRNLQYALDAGLISEKSFKAMIKAGEAYIPLKRIMEPEAFERKKTKSGALKRVKGVEEGRDIKTASPMLSILENTEALFQMAEKNRAINDFVTRNADSGLIEKVKQKARPIEVSEKEVTKFLEEHGIEGDAESFNIFRPAPMTLADNEFVRIVDGKREIWRTDQQLADAFKALDGDAVSMNIAMKMARFITTVKRIGITMTPDFVTSNFIRDQMTAVAASKGNVIPFVDVVVAMGDLFKKNEHYYNWLKSGGARGSFMELNDRYLMRDVFKLDKSTGFLDSAINVIKTPVDAMLAAAHIVEMAPRLAEFKKVSAGETSGPAVFRGGFAAREVTLDFQRMGAKMSAWNSITAFTNATIQGADKFARTLRDDPAGVALKAGLAITTPSILLWWANKDDPRYESTPRWEKDLYWIFPTDSWELATPEDNAEVMDERLKKIIDGRLYLNKGTVYRVPKPHEFGILFGSLPERILDKLVKDDPKAFKGFGETIAEIVKPSFVPDFATPVIEQWANKSLFTGRQMIPQNLEGVAPELRYTEYTSESAKQLAKITPWIAVGGNELDPIMIDNYVRQWAGPMGQYAVAMADKFLMQDAGKVAPESTLADIPAVKAFVVRYPGSNAQQITDFYDNKKRFDEIRATNKRLASMGEEYGDEFSMSLNGVAKALSNLRSEIRAINANPEIKPKEKRQLIDGKYYMMIEAAKLANQRIHELEKSMESASGE